MIRLEVPARVYTRVIYEMEARHRSTWAVVDLVPGRAWRIHATPWEATETLWRAEDLLRALRDALRAKPKAR